MYFALISSPKNLEQVERYRQIAQRLAHPAGLTDAAARELAREGKPFVHIDGGLHSTEVAGAQHTLLLAYDLVSRAQTEDPGQGDPRQRDPDALADDQSRRPEHRERVVHVERRHAVRAVAAAELYQKYIGHDNNRDAYMLNMVESRVIAQAWREWEPHIIYVHHQSSPFPTRIWLPPFAEPIGSDAPFLMSREVNMIGMAIAKGLEERGQVGATHMGTAFDAWYPGYIDYMPIFQNITAFWTETALFQYATPHEYTMADFPESFRDLRPQSLYPSPWRPGWWRLGDAVEYMHTASLAVLDYASKYKEALLYNRYRPAAIRLRAAGASRRTPTSSRRSSAIRSPPSSCCAGWRSAACASRSSTAAGDGRRRDVPGGHVGRADGSGVRGAGAAGAQRAELSRHAPVSRRAAGAAVRCRGMDAADADGRARRGGHDAARRRCAGELKLLGPAPDPKRKPAPYNSADVADAAPFDSVPGIGFDSNPERRGDRAAGGPDDRLRAGPRGRSGAEQRVPCGQQRVEGRAARACESDHRHCRRALLSSAASPSRRRPSWCATLALVAERVDARRGRAASPARASASSVPGVRAWTKGGRDGCSNSTASRSSPLRPADFRAPLREKVDVVILAEDARIPVEGGGGGAAAGEAPAAAARPCGPNTPTCERRGSRRFDQFVRTGGTVVCLGGAARSRSRSSSCR